MFTCFPGSHNISPRIAVIGAGYVGSRLIARLAADDAVAYGRSNPALPGRAFRLLDLDLDSSQLGQHLPARILYTVPPPAGGRGEARLARFLAMLDPAPERIVYLSTSGVYGDCAGELVSETRPAAPGTARARRRLAAEQLLQATCSKSGIACIILRVPAIYGPGRLGLERIRAREPQILESDANPGNRIHVDDLSTAAIAALERSIPGGIYNVGDGDFRSSTWFARTVAQLAGLDPPPLISRAEALATLPASRLSFLKESRRLDTGKMRELLGVRLRYPDAQTGIRDSLRESPAD